MIIIPHNFCCVTAPKHAHMIYTCIQSIQKQWYCRLLLKVWFLVHSNIEDERCGCGLSNPFQINWKLPGLKGNSVVDPSTMKHGYQNRLYSAQYRQTTDIDRKRYFSLAVSRRTSTSMNLVYIGGIIWEYEFAPIEELFTFSQVLHW